MNNYNYPIHNFLTDFTIQVPTTHHIMPEWLSKLMGNSISLEEELINLRLTSKQMQRASKKCDKNEKEAVKKLKKVSLP